MSSILVYLVRHGQTMENIQGIIQGQLDTKLDKFGVGQATTVADALKDIPFDYGFSSDLTRALDTAEAILEHHAGIELCKTVLLRERNMGNLQGTIFKKQRIPPNDTIEASSAFVERALLFWDQMILPMVKRTAAAQSKCSSCVLVVSHGAFIKTLAGSLMEHRNIGKGPGVTLGWCPNASISLVEVREDGTGSLLGYGNISHLAKPGLLANVDELPSQ